MSLTKAQCLAAAVLMLSMSGCTASTEAAHSLEPNSPLSLRQLRLLLRAGLVTMAVKPRSLVRHPRRRFFRRTQRKSCQPSR